MAFGIELRLVAGMGHERAAELGGNGGVRHQQPVRMGQEVLRVARPSLLERVCEGFLGLPSDVCERVAIAEKRQLVVVHVDQQRTVAKRLQHEPQLHARQPRLAGHDHIRINARG